jgi:hypothetical protein
MMRAFSEFNGMEVFAGDTVSGEKVDCFSRARTANKSGKVVVHGREYYDRVFGLIVTEDDGKVPRYCEGCGKLFAEYVEDYIAIPAVCDNCCL